MTPFETLEKEGRWIEEEYFRCFGIEVAIQQGTPNYLVNGYQAAIFRWHIEKLKEQEK